MISVMNKMSLYALQRHVSSANGSDERNFGFSSILGSAQLAMTLAGQTKHAEQKEILKVFECKDAAKIVGDLTALYKSLPRPFVAANVAFARKATGGYVKKISPLASVLTLPTSVYVDRVNFDIKQKCGIENMVSVEDLGDIRTQAVLISTLRLNDKWKHKFALGQDRDFHPTNDAETICDVPYLENEFAPGKIKYLNRTDRQYVALDYENKHYAMVLVKADLEHMRVCPNEIRQLLRSPSKERIKVIVPDLDDIECQLDFKAFAKSAYGIKTVYSGFEFNGTASCAITTSIMRTKCSFNSGGASFEGAAKSVVKTRSLSGPKIVRFNHAYVMMNVRKSDGLIVSMQYIANPKQSSREDGSSEVSTDWKESVCSECFQPRWSTSENNVNAHECGQICDGDGDGCECPHHVGEGTDSDSESDSDDDAPIKRPAKAERAPPALECVPSVVQAKGPVVKRSRSESSAPSGQRAKKARTFIDLTL